ncbi:ribbon-helix-helix domain-containing protein [Helicobacter pylori]|uniref:ribbon-helix-helix domain-containing protein n=1 Tax=Helicobacter pylori TaxID=210 RepID=UPI000D343172|nr:ribbon-helix-helix domain-containing protein [Helicobacter pylori]MCQ2614854.1 ribbon-helix-helix domain-containing protein [Helicobacter pylori]MCQ2708800.1 ribbon-helix-helix domain-containing protein [Helicobacter pylori]MCQ2769181.1 ribbon-helix-helix domain-containing protein [Helicobacter pylori]MDO7823700.1 ribbon-helix-helix domain-containing protein [Helicobacter pylori]PUD47396.1 CopG family transcriptional regulator [Helicobacter pylori]
MEKTENTDETHLRGTKNKLGRKPKADANKKTRAVSLYFSDEQYQKLEKMANEEESVGSYIKRYILKALRKIEQNGA